MLPALYSTGAKQVQPVSLRKTPCFQLSPSLTQDIKPQESRHFSQNPKIFHFETLETAKLKFQRGCTPSMWSLRHRFHRENLNKVDTFPQSASAPSKPALPSRKNHPAEFAARSRKPKGTTEPGHGKTRVLRRSRKHQPENPPFLPDASMHPLLLPYPSEALEGPS